MSRYGTGYIADRHATHDGSARDFLGAQTPSPGGPARFLASRGGTVPQRSQGQTSTCVGFAIVDLAIRLRAAALGLVMAPGSPVAARNMALQLEQMAEHRGGEALEDVGCQPSLAIKAIRSFGLPTEASYPFDPAHCTEPLSLSELESGAPTVTLFVREWRGIVDDGAARVEQCLAALAADIPVVLAVCASDGAFEDPTDTGLNPYGALRASTTVRTTDHMCCLVDQREALPGGEGGTEFLLANPWGLDWGDRGCWWIAESFLAASDALYVVDIGATP